MAISVKVMRRKNEEISYVRAALKGMALTFSHLKRPSVTMQYPEETETDDWKLSGRWRGTHRMLTDEQGRSKCVACAPRSVRQTASNWFRAKTKKGIAIRSFTKSTNSGAYSAAIVRKYVRKRPSTSGSTMKMPSTVATDSCMTWSVCVRRPTPSRRCGIRPIRGVNNR